MNFPKSEGSTQFHIAFVGRVPKPGVDAVSRQQFGARARFDHAAFFEDVDAIDVMDRAEPVRDDEGGEAPHQGVQRFHDLRFRLEVKRAGRLVEQEDRRVFQKGAGQADPLLLAAAEPHR